MSKIHILKNRVDTLIQANGKTLKVVPLTPTIDSENLYYSVETTLKITAMTPQLSHQYSSFQNMISTLVPLEQPFSNYVTSITLPKKASEVESINMSQTISSYDLKSHFNYVATNYDTSQQFVEETNLPSVLENVSVNLFSDLDWGVDSQNSPINYSTISQRYKNFVLSPAGEAVKTGLYASDIPGIGLQTEASDHLLNYPYYNQIKISDRVSNDFSSFISMIGVFDAILTAYRGNTTKGRTFRIKRGENEPYEISLPTFRLLNWAQRPEMDPAREDYFPLDPDAMDDSLMVSRIKKYVFVGFMRSMAVDNMRSWEEIASETHCYKEDFVYSIEKYQNTVDSELVQTLYLPAVDNISIFNDTQVKYAQTYVYKCDAHYIIVGNRYRYTDLTVYPGNEAMESYATVKVINEPSMIIVPFGFFEEKINVIQPPPLPPQVNFVTQANANNLVSIYLSPTKGTHKGKFTPLLEKDLDQLQQMKQTSISSTEEFDFRTLPQSGLYEIFKTSVAPKSYEDFKDKRLTDIRMSYQTSDAIYRDKVSPNKKYYYLFRQLNSKDLVSNPSAIYEVELLKDADDSKIVVSIYNFPKESSRENTRKFQSLFQITPAVEHVVFDDRQAGLDGTGTLRGTVDDLRLGVAEHSLWGQKFKFRIKSTTSGRIIDYNITFRLTKNNSEADF